MKRKSSCLSHMTLALVPAGSLFLAFALCGVAPGKIEPTGTNVGVVQFDAVIELNRYSPDSLRHDYTVMFARYWVARDYYSAAVVWAEPQSTDMFFAVRPPGLSFASNRQEFKVQHESIKKDNEAYKKPVGERGVFRYKFGSYPIDNVRFAEKEALAARIYAADLEHLQDANQTHTETLSLSKATCEAENSRSVSRLRIQASAGHIDSIDLFDEKEHLLKSINYEYANKDGKVYLRRQIGTLPERPMTVGFNGEGMKVTLDGKEYRYRELEAPNHAGGRRCTVEYEPVKLGAKEVILPIRVTVRGGKDDQILRSVHLTNFKKVKLDNAGAAETARQYARFTDEQRKYQELRSRYWGKRLTEIEEQDTETIRQLRTRIENDAAEADRSPGEKLKHLNILMELDMILGDVTGLDRHYERYLSTLRESKLSKLTLVGGYGVIETAMFQCRQNEAQRLLGRWLDTVAPMRDPESVLLFARRQLAKTRFWTTIKLLEKLSAKPDLGVEVKFEAAVLRCTALDDLCKLLQADDLAKKGLVAKVQADWVASIGIDNLKTMLTNGIAQAKRFFAELPAPTESQQALKRQLDKIAQEVKGEENQKSGE